MCYRGSGNWAFFFGVCMRPFAIAGIITVIFGVIFVGLFSYWKNETLPKSLDVIHKISDMEKNGFPDFEFNLVDGNKNKISDFKGKLIIINFWASWCSPCLEEFPSMLNLLEKLGDKAVLVAISQDSTKEDIEAFIKSFPKVKGMGNVLIAWDEQHSLAQEFQADRLPESYVLDKNLKLSKKIIGSIDWASADALKFMEELYQK